MFGLNVPKTTNAAITISDENDSDCDGHLAIPDGEDCDDTDPNSTIQSEDGDCDGLLTADDCDDADANSTAIADDADCDGEGDCDDDDDTHGEHAGDNSSNGYNDEEKVDIMLLLLQIKLNPRIVHELHFGSASSQRLYGRTTINSPASANVAKTRGKMIAGSPTGSNHVSAARFPQTCTMYRG